MAELDLNNLIDPIVENTIKHFEEVIKSIDIQTLKDFQNDINELIALFQPFQEENNLLKSQPYQNSMSAKYDLQKKKIRIYEKFFQFQNKVNKLLDQTITMTYVHIDENGRREVRLFDNTIDKISIEEVSRYKYNYYKLGYEVNSGYKKLSDSIEYDDTQLQITATEITRRYSNYKKRVLWFYPNSWKGYTMSSMGPINEAFVNNYIHEIKLGNSLEQNIDTYMLGDYGAIKADATKGFMIGDVSKNEIQYAVKGEFGSPQGFTEIIKDLQQWSNLSTKDTLKQLVQKYFINELNRDYKPQIKEMTTQTIKNTSKNMIKDRNININIGIF